MAYRETVRIRERKAVQRDALLQAAEQLVRAGGFAALAIQSLAQRAGVSVGTVYRYFDNKEALAVEVFERVSAREVAAVAEAVAESSPLVPRIRQGVAVFARRALRAPKLWLTPATSRAAAGSAGPGRLDAVAVGSAAVTREPQRPRARRRS